VRLLVLSYTANNLTGFLSFFLSFLLVFNELRGADLSGQGVPRPSDPADPETRKFWLNRFAAGNVDVTKAFFEHSKVLICALNGPVVGLSAALVSHADFI
jgi:enoyl-CoA hydratase/carnithine racemase